MRPVLLDTSVYIAAFRERGRGVLAMRSRGFDSHLWLSAVVLEELHAGARGSDSGILEELERDFEKADRLLVPSSNDWVQTGRVLSGIAAEYGYEAIGRSRLTNDALIAMSAARRGITVITANARDFARLAQFRAFQWEVA